MRKGRLLICALFLFLAGMGFSSAKVCKVSCVRQSHNESFGHDANFSPVVADIGECHEVTSNQKEECNRHVSYSGTVCPRRCEPRSYEVRELSNRSGPFSVQVVRSCYANRHHCNEGCVRKPSYLYLFPNSKYQTRIDIGKCIGRCNNGSYVECMPVRNKTLAIDGPNGPVVINKIESCSCKNTTCYRADYLESYSARIGVDNNNTTRRAEKVFNVGRCIGTCEGIWLPERCLPSPSNCIIPIPPKQAKCVPTVGKAYTFTDIDGNTRSIPAVVECGCSSG